MNRWPAILGCVAISLLLFPQRCLAPLIYTPGEGWRYEQAGTTSSWHRTRAKDQLELAQAAFDQKDYGLAFKAARRTVQQWPFSDYAPKAQYLIGRCHEATQQDEKAFKAYQTLAERYPKVENYDEVIQRQFGDAKLALNNFVVVLHLGIALGQRLVGLEGFLILLGRFVAAADQVLGLGGVVRERPLLDGAPGG